jgi:hypothetical protein
VASLGFLDGGLSAPGEDEGLPEDPAEWLASLGGSLGNGKNDDEEE